MKKIKAKTWFLISIGLAVVFLVKTAMDYGVYSNTLNSAPFEVWILVNALYFLLPALIALIIGLVRKKK